MPKRSNIIATDKLNIDKLKAYFKEKNVLEIHDIFSFYNNEANELKSTTVNWRIQTLVQSGVLKRIGRGKFILGNTNTKEYIPEISSVTSSLFKKLKREFPFANLCIWNTSALNEFMLHQPNRFFILIETDREATDAIFYFLRETKKTVFIDPNENTLQRYITNDKDVLIVKSLVSEAPTLKINNVVTASLEKMLVDIYCDSVIFSAQQGREMRIIFEEAFSKYTINQSKILRYMNRRGKKNEFNEFVKTITTLWQ